MSTSVTFQDEAAINAALGDVRSDATSTDWVLLGHVDQNPNLIELQGSGSGGLDELLSNLDDAQVQYALLRFNERVDMSNTIKFVYIHWNGEEVPFAKKGKFGVVHGAAQEKFVPRHLDFDVTRKSELTFHIIEERIKENSGTKLKVLDSLEAASRPERTFTSSPSSQQALLSSKTGAALTKNPGVNQTSIGIDVDSSVADALQEVRNAQSEVDWVAFSFVDQDPKKQFTVLGSGAGGREELKKLFTSDVAAYALFRTTDIYEGITNVKFVYFTWVGDSVKPMTKAKLSTLKGSIEQVIGAAHLAIHANSHSDVMQTLHFNY